MHLCRCLFTCSLFIIVQSTLCQMQSALLKKAEDTDGDAAEMSATKMRLQQQQNSTALVVRDPEPNNGGLHPLSLSTAAASGRRPVCS